MPISFIGNEQPETLNDGALLIAGANQVVKGNAKLLFGWEIRDSYQSGTSMLGRVIAAFGQSSEPREADLAGIAHELYGDMALDSQIVRPTLVAREHYQLAGPLYEIAGNMAGLVRVQEKIIQLPR